MNKFAYSLGKLAGFAGLAGLAGKELYKKHKKSTERVTGGGKRHQGVVRAVSQTKKGPDAKARLGTMARQIGKSTKPREF